MIVVLMAWLLVSDSVIDVLQRDGKCVAVVVLLMIVICVCSSVSVGLLTDAGPKLLSCGILCVSMRVVMRRRSKCVLVGACGLGWL